MPLFDVKVPSGMVFKCRKLSKEYVTNAGQVPVSLSAQVLATANPANDTEQEAQARFSRMTESERFAAMQMSAQAIRYCVVEPRLIVGPVNGHKNAISVDDLTLEDFGHLSTWTNGGGDEAEGLKTFRRKRK